MLVDGRFTPRLTIRFLGRVPCTAVLASFVLLLLEACADSPKGRAEVDENKLRLFRPLPVVMEWDGNPVTEEKIRLGRMLYFDPRLSKGQDISCNTCHRLHEYGVDGKPVSEGHGHRKGARNSPTVYNAAAQFVQFWDGRAADMEEQAKGPVLNPAEMAMADGEQVAARLKSIPDYVEAFREAFPQDKDPVTLDNAAKAIGAFERKLVTPGRWDLFLQGDKRALTEEEKAGFNAFVGAGCHACHYGALVGGNIYQRLGVAHPWPRATDLGRYQVTKHDGDRFIFKAPPLRNVEKTAPYFHDGSEATLEGAVRKMAYHQLGKELKPEEVRAIVAWLKSLTGEIPAEYVKVPALPRSTAQ